MIFWSNERSHTIYIANIFSENRRIVSPTPNIEQSLTNTCDCTSHRYIFTKLVIAFNDSGYIAFARHNGHESCLHNQLETHSRWKTCAHANVCVSHDMDISNRQMAHFVHIVWGLSRFLFGTDRTPKKPNSKFLNSFFVYLTQLFTYYRGDHQHGSSL